MRKLLKLLALVGVSALPALAFGQTLNPQGDDAAWPLYVMGNGEAIYEILTAIKLLVLSPAFKSLLLFVATVGTVVTGVAAGFNPGQNVIKFFSFFLSAWLVIFVSNQLKSDVAILDKVNNYNNVVTGVPAIVAVPASVISQTGHWMTTKIEQNFSIPSSMQLSGSKSGGTFALPAKMIADSGKMVITSAPLKANLSNYVGDCLVPALARNNVSLQELMSSTDFWKTAEFKHEGILTKYVPITEGPTAMSSLNTWRGELKTCAEAYTAITSDLENYGSELLTGSSAAWTNAGVMVPLENMFSDTMNWISGSTGANPAGLIKQRVVLNSLSGAFRSAATQTGNNEMLTNIAVTTAEESQRSGWAASAAIFNNMMGYVFSTLQAFIFAIVPLIIVAALIPGFGKTIFVNYGQIMLWLALWEPMLAVVNFLIAVFAKNAMGGILGSNDAMGFTFNNNFVMTQEANNLVIASQFLGTMVPMITWGLVKGAMAFTEFISHGIGANLGAQAGKEMATGNMGLNNAQFDNFSANKLNTTSQSSVGFGDVNSSLHAGHGGTVGNFGGSSSGQYGSTNQMRNSAGQKAESSVSASQAASILEQTAASEAAKNSLSAGTSGGVGQTAGTVVTAGQSHGTGTSGAKTGTATDGTATSEQNSRSHSVDASTAQNSVVAGQGGISPGSGGGGGKGGKGGGGGSPVGGSVGLNASVGRTHSNDVTEAAKHDKGGSKATSATESATLGTSASSSNTFGTSQTGGSSATVNKTASSGLGAEKGTSHSLGASNTLNAQKGTSAGTNMSMDMAAAGLFNDDSAFASNGGNLAGNVGSAWGAADSVMTASQNLSAQQGQALVTQAQAAQSLYNGNMGAAADRASAMPTDTSGFTAGMNSIKDKFDSLSAHNSQIYNGNVSASNAFRREVSDVTLDNFADTFVQPGDQMGKATTGVPLGAPAAMLGAGLINLANSASGLWGSSAAAAPGTATAASSGASALTGIGAAGATGVTSAGIFGTGIAASLGLGYLAFNDNYETNTGVANAISSGGQSFANFFGAQKTFGSRNMPETN